MGKRKSDINFIASQKLVAKKNQSASFEFILVIAVVLLVAVMGAMFYMSIMNNKNAETEIANLERELEDIKSETDIQVAKFAKFEEATDENGEKIILSTSLDKDGNIVYEYEWISINKVAKSLAEQLDNANATSNAVQSQVDLTSVIFFIIFSEAEECDCNIISITFKDSTVQVSLLGPTIYSWSEYKDALLRNVNTATGLDNTKYIEEIDGTSVDKDTSGKFRFNISFKVISDTLYLVEDEGGTNL